MCCSRLRMACAIVDAAQMTSALFCCLVGGLVVPRKPKASPVWLVVEFSRLFGGGILLFLIGGGILPFVW